MASKDRRCASAALLGQMLFSVGADLMNEVRDQQVIAYSIIAKVSAAVPYGLLAQAAHRLGHPAHVGAAIVVALVIAGAELAAWLV
jgi:hypothetical protein